MKLVATALHIGGTTTRHAVDMPRYRRTLHATVAAGTRLRSADKTIAAAKFDGIEKYVWIGHANAAQMAAHAAYDGAEWPGV